MDIAKNLVRAFLEPRLRAQSRYASEAVQLQRSVLMSLMRRAATTKWGSEHDFRNVRSWVDFASRTPITTYEDLEPYIARMRSGERNVLWPGKVNRFAISSGTTSSRSKFIPVSSDGLRRCHLLGGRDVTASFLAAHPDTRIFEGSSFILSGSIHAEECTPVSKAGDVSALMQESIPGFLKPVIRFEPPTDIAGISDFEKKRECLAQRLVGKDVRTISGVPSWMLSVLRRCLEVSGKSNITELWPGLELFAHGGVGFAPYRKIYEELIPSPSMHYVETYNASEGFFGVQTDPSDHAMTLMLDYDVFYEFIPMDVLDTPQEKAIPLWEVETGVTYAMVISTSSGLWRYKIGDTVKFTRRDPYRFVIEGRTKQFINTFGEELMVGNAERGISAACAVTGAIVREYTAAPLILDEGGGCFHQWLVEFEKAPASLEEFADNLDSSLRNLNSDYDAKRYKDITLQRLQILQTPRGLFDMWLASQGKLGGQHKIPRLSNTRTYMDQLLELRSKMMW